MYKIIQKPPLYQYGGGFLYEKKSKYGLESKCQTESQNQMSEIVSISDGDAFG